MRNLIRTFAATAALVAAFAVAPASAQAQVRAGEIWAFQNEATGECLTGDTDRVFTTACSEYAVSLYAMFFWSGGRLVSRQTGQCLTYQEVLRTYMSACDTGREWQWSYTSAHLSPAPGIRCIGGNAAHEIFANYCYNVPQLSWRLIRVG